MAFLFFLILPVTVASIEQSFIKLKIIKNYLRNIVSRSIKNSLLSMEAKEAKEIDME